VAAASKWTRLVQESAEVDVGVDVAGLQLEGVAIRVAGVVGVVGLEIEAHLEPLLGRQPLPHRASGLGRAARQGSHLGRQLGHVELEQALARDRFPGRGAVAHHDMLAATLIRTAVNGRPEGSWDLSRRSARRTRRAGMCSPKALAVRNRTRS
jgi:hypothetical protein